MVSLGIAPRPQPHQETSPQYRFVKKETQDFLSWALEFLRVYLLFPQPIFFVNKSSTISTCLWFVFILDCLHNSHDPMYCFPCCFLHQTLPRFFLLSRPSPKPALSHCQTPS